MASTCIYMMDDSGLIYGYHEGYAAARDTSDFCRTAAHEFFTGFFAGQEDDGHVQTHWFVHRSYLAFDTSVISDPINAASLYMFNEDIEQADLENDIDVKVYCYDWAEPLCDNTEANYDGAYGATASLEGSWWDTSVTSLSIRTWMQMDVTASRIDTSGCTRFSIATQHDVDAVQTSCDAFLTISHDELPLGGGGCPFLIVDYTPAGNYGWIF